MSNPESGALGSRCRESSRAKLIYILVFESVSIGNRVDSEPNGKCSEPPWPVKVLGPCPRLKVKPSIKCKPSVTSRLLR